MSIIADDVRAAKTSPATANIGGHATSAKRDRTAVNSPYLHKLQLRHFILFDVLPFIGTLGAIALLFVHPISAVDIGLFFFFWAVTGFALTVGFHRLFTHCAFKTSAAMRVLFTICGC